MTHKGEEIHEEVDVNDTGDTYVSDFTESIPVNRLELGFIINVEGIETLGEGLDKAAINLLRWGMDSFYIVATNRDTGEEYIVANGEVTPRSAGRLEAAADLIEQANDDEQQPE